MRSPKISRAVSAVVSEIGAAAISMHLSLDQSRARTVGSWFSTLTMVGTANR